MSPRPPAGVPLRICVHGASMTISTRPWGHGGHRTSYPRQLEAVLAERGIATHIENFGRQATTIADAVTRWEDTVHAWAPDVVVLHYGMFECIPKAVPVRLEQWVNGWDYHGGRLARRGRAAVLKVWPLARSWQRFLDRRLGVRTNRMRPEVFAWELRHFIGLTKGVGNPLILVANGHDFGGRYTHWMPNINKRVARVNAVLRNVVAEFDDSVRVVEVSALVEEAGGSDVLPDGVHFPAELNRRLAELLADEIEAW